MITEIINKILLLLLVASSLNVVRHLYYFIQAYVKSNSEQPQKYLLSSKSLWLLAISIGYIFVAIFDGVFLK